MIFTIRMRLIVFALICLGFIACDDSYQFRSENESIIRQELYHVPEHLYASSLWIPTPQKTDTVALGSKIKVWSQYYYGDEPINQGDIEFYLQRIYWVVHGNDTLQSGNRELTLDQPGVFPITLNGVDYWGDTLSDTLNIYVNTPLSIQLVEPYHLMALPPSQDSLGVAFYFELKGVDSWEVPDCYISVSTDPDSLWESIFWEVPCYSPTRLPIFGNDSLYYWSAFATTGEQPIQNTTSPIWTFRIRRSQDTTSHLRVPLGFLDQGPSAVARIRLLNELGQEIRDTLIPEGEPWVDFVNLPPASALQVLVNAPDYPDYTPDTQTVVLPVGGFTTSSSVVLTDSIPPRIWPQTNVYVTSKRITFNLEDLGSGLAQESYSVEIQGPQSIDFSNLTHSVQVDLSGKLPCKLTIKAKDGTGNTAGLDQFWYVYSSDSIRIAGPYPTHYRGELP